MGVIKQKLYYYVQTQNSITHTVTEKNILDFYEAGTEMCNSIAECNEFEYKAAQFYVGILVNCIYNLKKVDKYKAKQMINKLSDYRKIKHIKVTSLIGTPYFCKILMLYFLR